MLEPKCAKRYKCRGLSLVELLVAVLILLPLLTVVMKNFITCMEMNILAQQTSLAVWGERSRIAAIEKTSFDQVHDTYNNQTFTVSGLTGIGITYVDDTNPDLLVVRVAYSWRDRQGRVNGEDTNLNGQLNNGEDKNNNGRLDSPVGFATLIYNKS